MRACQKLASKLPMAMADGGSFQPPGFALLRMAETPRMKHGGDLKTGKGGNVPGSGTGDKIAAKYEPGEFVVSNDMLDSSPGLREKLHGLRDQVLNAKGMTAEQADANALSGGKLRADDGYGTEPWRPVNPKFREGSPISNRGALAMADIESTRNAQAALTSQQSAARVAPVAAVAPAPVAPVAPLAPVAAPAAPVPVAASASTGAAGVLQNPGFTGAGPNANFLQAARQFTDPVQTAARNAAYPAPLSSAAALEAAYGERVNPTPKPDGRYGLPANPTAAAPGPTPPAAGVVDRALTAGKNAAGTLSKLAGRVAAPIGAVIEGVDVARVAQDPNATGIDVATQAAQGAGRLAAAGVGASTGAAVGTALMPGVGTIVGGLAGGAMGYYGANKAIELGRTAAGVDPRAPADRIVDPTAPLAAVAKPAAPKPPSAATVLSNAGDATMPGQDAGRGPLLAGRSGDQVDGAPGVSKFKQNGKTLYSNVTTPGDNDRLMSGKPGLSVVPGMSRASIDAALGGQSADAVGADNAIRAANLRDGVDMNRGTSAEVAGRGAKDMANLANSPLGTPGRAFAQKQLLAQEEQATTRRGQDITASNVSAANKLATQKFDLEAPGTRAENTAKQRLNDVQGTIIDPNSTEEQRTAAVDKLRALQGKYEKEAVNRFTVVPGGQEVDPASGMPVTRPARVFNNQIGDFVEQAANNARPAPNAGAIAMLKSNPKSAAQFDAKYGPGASAKYTAQR